MLNMRNHPPKPENFRMVATSDDLGRTLSKASPDRALVEPPAQASLLRLTIANAGDRNRLLFANPASAQRERLTVRLSYDEGLTWPVARVVHEGPAAYSSLVVLQDFSIGLLFERGDRSPYERITFARFTLEWLTEGRDRVATPDIVNLPDVPDPHGFAGAFAGISSGHLLAGGGANFPDGVMPWNGGKKVWHDRVFALDLRDRDAAWREIGRLPAPNGYGVSLTVPEGVLLIGGGDAARNFREVWMMTLDAGRLSFRASQRCPCRWHRWRAQSWAATCMLRVASRSPMPPRLRPVTGGWISTHSRRAGRRCPRSRRRAASLPRRLQQATPSISWAAARWLRMPRAGQRELTCAMPGDSPVASGSGLRICRVPPPLRHRLRLWPLAVSSSCQATTARRADWRRRRTTQASLARFCAMRRRRTAGIVPAC